MLFVFYEVPEFMNDNCRIVWERDLRDWWWEGVLLLEQKFFDLIEANPVIAAIKDDRGLADCCSCEDIRVVFILYGDICNINRIVEQVKAANNWRLQNYQYYMYS